MLNILNFCLFAAVVAVLQSLHAVHTANLVIRGLSAIRSLTRGNAVNRSRLGKAGACAGN